MNRFIVFIISLSVLCGGFGNAVGLRAPFKNLPAVELSFNIGGQEPEWKQVSLSASKARYSWQDYTLDLRLDRKRVQNVLSFELRAPKIAVTSYTAKVTMLQVGLHSVMVPNIGPLGANLNYYHQHNKWLENVPLYRCLVPCGFEQDARANSDAPFILLCDNKGNNAISAGWAMAERQTTLKGFAEGGNYVLSLSRQEDIPFKGEVLKDALIVSAARKSWFDVEREYAKTFDRFSGRHHDPLPDWAFDPVFCTWYCYLHEINQKHILDSARKCSELGIKTYLIDAGWDAKPGEWWGDLDNGILGDFIVGTDRFPDLAGAIKQMQDMGLRVQLWTAPFWQARKSKTYLERTKDWHIWEGDSESYNLCPKHPGTRGLFKENYTRIAKDLGIDGMWLDVCDSIPAVCDAKHEHLDQTMGNAVVDCMAAVRDALRSVKPDAITEARTMHANINTKRALDVVACGDTPENYEIIRLANLHLRPWAYDVVLKNDPMIWPKKADEKMVGKFLATMMVSGVPALSVDFLTAPDWQCKMTKAWLKFYNKHRQTLLKGKFALFGENYGIPDMMFVNGGEAIVYLVNPKTRDVEMPKRIERVILLNCTDSDTVRLRLPSSSRRTVQSYRPDWTKSGPPESLAPGETSVSLIVPQGGAAVIEAWL